MKSATSQDKTSWTKNNFHTFYDIYIIVIGMEMRPNTHFNKVNCKFVMTIFKDKTGHSFTKLQSKNK